MRAFISIVSLNHMTFCLLLFFYHPIKKDVSWFFCIAFRFFLITILGFFVIFLSWMHSFWFKQCRNDANKNRCSWDECNEMRWDAVGNVPFFISFWYVRIAHGVLVLRCCAALLAGAFGDSLIVFFKLLVLLFRFIWWTWGLIVIFLFRLVILVIVGRFGKRLLFIVFVFRGWIVF